MSTIDNASLSSLVLARRLMISAQEIEAQRHGKKLIRKSAKENMEEDQALLSGETPGVEKTTVGNTTSQAVDGIDINLSDLNKQLRTAQSNAVDSQAARIDFQQTETVQLSIRYISLEQVDGLVVRNQNNAETDRYAFDFQDGATLKITDKWTGKYTRIWGDPHVDTSDQEGDNNGEFSDLKSSNSQTTLMLQDGTRLTFTAKDNGLIEKIDLFKGSQHLGGVGAGSKGYDPATGMFSREVDAHTSSSSIASGDTVFAGADGTDWYDSAGRLVWGKVTANAPITRPDAILEMSYRYSVTQQLSVTSLAVQA